MNINVVSFVALVGVASSVPAAAQSTVVESYTLLAERAVRAKRLTLTAGDLGVTDPTNGLFSVRNQLDAPESAVAANTVRVRNNASVCAKIFANVAPDVVPGCSDVSSFESPFASLATACGFPAPFPACDPSTPTIVVNPGETLSLPPGTYGDVVIGGSPSGFGTLQLSGTYQFCSVKASLEAVMSFTTASTVNVQNALILSRATTTNPTISAEDIHFFVQGTSVRIARNAAVTAVVCAPNATLGINNGAMLNGRFIARQVRLKRNAIIGIPVSTTTSTTLGTTTSTIAGSTTTTIPGSTTTTLVPGSTTTTLVPGSTTTTIPGNTTTTIPGNTTTTSLVPGSTTTTSLVPSSSTTSTTTSTSTTTTLVPDGGPCTDNEQCQSHLCENGECVPELVEICGNCIDDNLNNLTDFEDPACCSGSAGQVFVSDLKRGKMKAQSADESLLKLKSILATSGFSADPAAEEVQLQIRQVGSDEVLCTVLPVGAFTQKGRVYKFKNPDDSVPSAQNLRMVMVKLAKNGTVRFKARGKQTRFAMPTLDTLRVTVGFRDPSGENAPRCSTNAAAFRTTKKGALVYP